MVWQRTTFNMAVSAGGGNVEQIAVEGWTNALFAIDERIYTRDTRRRVWCITHLPTGYAVLSVLGTRQLAMKVADSLASAADWQFTNPLNAKARGPATKSVMGQFPRSTFVNQEYATPAKRAFQYPEEAASGIVTATADETPQVARSPKGIEPDPKGDAQAIPNTPADLSP